MAKQPPQWYREFRAWSARISIHTQYFSADEKLQLCLLIINLIRQALHIYETVKVTPEDGWQPDRQSEFSQFYVARTTLSDFDRRWWSLQRSREDVTRLLDDLLDYKMTFLTVSKQLGVEFPEKLRQFESKYNDPAFDPYAPPPLPSPPTSPPHPSYQKTPVVRHHASPPAPFASGPAPLSNMRDFNTARPDPRANTTMPRPQAGYHGHGARLAPPPAHLLATGTVTAPRQPRQRATSDARPPPGFMGPPHSRLVFEGEDDDEDEAVPLDKASMFKKGHKSKRDGPSLSAVGAGLGKLFGRRSSKDSHSSKGNSQPSPDTTPPSSTNSRQSSLRQGYAQFPPVNPRAQAPYIARPLSPSRSAYDLRSFASPPQSYDEQVARHLHQQLNGPSGTNRRTRQQVTTTWQTGAGASANVAGSSSDEEDDAEEEEEVDPRYYGHGRYYPPPRGGPPPPGAGGSGSGAGSTSRRLFQ
ncbi:hypothetical protein EXIGLDRAFT_830168 [Exidia glandulosa HHB12029]|uniref:Uncharacterized protein n=1 Tax=Exidia glandulosa HHB12029 TaxID=1314781 RepID=A0A165NTL4_EXIGL|nr:hypothetical protein EXIGLDRAFT_830168 [Exidia glandulosa HHB12029]